MMVGERVHELLVFTEPMDLEHGKSTRALLSCAESFLHSSWFHGVEHRITICAQVHDRAVGRGFREAIS
eukprot:6429178-Amphidinium_carterae.1